MVDDPAQFTFQFHDDAPYTDDEWAEIKRLWFEELQNTVIVTTSLPSTNTRGEKHAVF